MFNLSNFWGAVQHFDTTSFKMFSYRMIITMDNLHSR